MSDKKDFKEQELVVTESLDPDETTNLPASISTIEQVTDRIWHDGKKVYRRFVNFGTLPNVGVGSVNITGFNTADVSDIVSMDCIASNGSTVYVDSRHDVNDFIEWTVTLATPNAIRCDVTNDMRAFSGKCTLDYTRTDR